MLRIPLVVFLLSLCCISCASKGYQKDAEIDEDLRHEMDTLNKQVIRYIAAGDAKAIAAISCDELKMMSSFKSGLKELQGTLATLAENRPYKVLHQFYTRSLTKGRPIVLKSGEADEEGEHDYTLQYTANTRKTFASVVCLEDSFQSFAVLIVWCKYNSQWKLFCVHAGPMKLYGRDAVDWYYLAKIQYDKQAIVDAANTNAICRGLLRPGGECWTYHLDKELKAQIDQIGYSAEHQYHFPMPMASVASAPEIFGGSAIFLPAGYYPVFFYTTKQNIKDTAALSRECDSVNAHIGDVFEHVDHYNKTIYYTVYSHIPKDSHDHVPCCRFMKASAAPWHF